MWQAFEIEWSVIPSGWLVEWVRNIVATYEKEEELWRMKIMDGEYVTDLDSVLTAVDLIRGVKNSMACKEDTQNLFSVECADLWWLYSKNYKLSDNLVV